MAAPVVVAVVAVLLGTVVALVALVVVLARRLAGAAREVRALERRLAPVLAQLQADAEITGRELARVGDALEGTDEDRG